MRNAERGIGNAEREQESTPHSALRTPHSALLLTFTLNAPLAAQDQRPKPLRFSGDVGFVNTTGNSEVTTLNVGERIEYKTGRLRVAQTLGTVYGRTGGVTNTSL